jgi:hypothetical protein
MKYNSMCIILNYVYVLISPGLWLDNVSGKTLSSAM